MPARPLCSATLGLSSGIYWGTNKGGLKDCRHRAKCMIFRHRFECRRLSHVPFLPNLPYQLHTCRGAVPSERTPNQRSVRERAANQRRPARLYSGQVPQTPEGRTTIRHSQLVAGRGAGWSHSPALLSPFPLILLTRCEALGQAPPSILHESARCVHL